MVRRYENGNYADLQKNLIQWEDDLKMCNDIGTEVMRPCKLTVRLIRLLARQKNDRKPFRANEEGTCRIGTFYCNGDYEWNIIAE